jgi:histidine phosphotransfer protein HptB
VVEEYLAEAATQIDLLRRAAARGDVATLRRVSHRLKSSSTMVGATRLSELCEAIEQDAQKDDKGQWPALVEETQAEFDLVAEALQAERGKYLPSYTKLLQVEPVRNSVGLV